MNTTHWLTTADCSLLQPDFSTDEGDFQKKGLRFLEHCLRHREVTTLANSLLEEIGKVVRADQVCILEGNPRLPICWEFSRRSLKFNGELLPRALVLEVLDRGGGVCQPPSATSPAFLAVAFPNPKANNYILLANRGREEFSPRELDYVVGMVQYFAQAMENARLWEGQKETIRRYDSLLKISEQLIEQTDTISLLEHIADQATQLLGCERASIFLWDQNRHELVGRPALGLPGGELRIAEETGIVGKVVKSGQIIQVDDVKADPIWDSRIDEGTGFQTRNLLCLPLGESEGNRIGAFEVMNKSNGSFGPRDVETLQALGRQTVAALQNVRQLETLLRINAEFENQARSGCHIIGESVKIKELRRTLDSVARTDLPVLVLGESGTGKDVAARAIHFSSHRQNLPFIPVNCAAIAETLLESELFGHEKGAFTDAHSQHAGKFEAASGGTLFLDEVGDLSSGGQAKLLRVLEEKIVYRVGGTQPIPVDTRIIAATNRNLAQAVRQGKFREDLFYRLSVVTLEIPPLRDRQEDILLLTEHFLEQFCRQAGRRVLKLSADAKKRLIQHTWPGNIRELKNTLERVAYLCPSDKVEPADLPFISRPLADPESEFSHLPLAEATAMFQMNHIKKAMERSGGNMSDAAKLLGLHRPNLYRKMKLLNMDVTNQ